MSKKISVGLIGTGYWGPNLAKSLVAAGAEIKWICDKNEFHLNSFSERYPQAKTTMNFRELLSDEQLDAVAIAAPTSTHYEITKAALLSKKHVFVEKPLTNNLQEATELRMLSEDSGLVLFVGHIFQYNNAIRYLRDAINQGVLGTTRYINFNRTNLGPVRTDVNAIWDLASHDVSIMYYILGALPKSVSAFGKSYLNSGVEDIVFLNFEYTNEVIVQVHASWLNPRKSRLITVVGDEKMAEIDDLDLEHPIKIYDKKVYSNTEKQDSELGTKKTNIYDGGTTYPVVKGSMPLEKECMDFLSSIRGGNLPLSDGRMGEQVVRICSFAMDSLRKGGARVYLGDQ